MVWGCWKEKDVEFKHWKIPSFCFWVYWRFLTKYMLSQISPCRLLLDVGCGEGEFLDLAIESEKIVTAIGVDPNIQRLKLIKKRGIHRIRGVGENLPLKPCVMDVVIMKNTLDHVREPQQVLREMCRVAMNDGQIYIFQGFVKKSKAPSYTHMRDFTMGELHSLLNIVGLKITFQKTFYSMRFQRILMLTPKLYVFFGRFLGHPSIQLIIANKTHQQSNHKLEWDK